MNKITVSVELFVIGIYLSIFSLSLWFLAFCFDYSLNAILGKDLPWYVDILGGVILNAIITVLAFICWIVQLCGIASPFFQ